MSLYKQKGSEVWWANISLPGHPRLRQSTGEYDRPAAQRIHDELKASLWRVEPALKGKTWGNAVAKWLNAAPRSEPELLSLSKFCRGYKDRLLSAVTPESIDAALAFCQTAGTYTRYRTTINAILHLSDMHIKLIVRRDRKTPPRDWLTHDQWLSLYAELPSHMKPMAQFAVSTGLRQANVLGLTWSRVDLRRKVVWVEAEDMKGGKSISIPLSEEALNVLKNQKDQHDEFVFTYRGKPVKEIKTAFISACLRAGLGSYSVPKSARGSVQGHDERAGYSGFTWHGFRHTWATWHVQNGTPLDVLQKLGGWSDLRMVMNYAHHSPSYLAGFADNTRRK